MTTPYWFGDGNRPRRHRGRLRAALHRARRIRNCSTPRAIRRWRRMPRVAKRCRRLPKSRSRWRRRAGIERWQGKASVGERRDGAVAARKFVALSASEQSRHHAADQADGTANAVVVAVVVSITPMPGPLHAATRYPVGDGRLFGLLDGADRGRFDGRRKVASGRARAGAGCIRAAENGEHRNCENQGTHGRLPRSRDLLRMGLSTSGSWLGNCLAGWLFHGARRSLHRIAPNDGSGVRRGRSFLSLPRLPTDLPVKPLCKKYSDFPKSQITSYIRRRPVPLEQLCCGVDRRSAGLKAGAEARPRLRRLTALTPSAHRSCRLGMRSVGDRAREVRSRSQATTA